MKTESALIFADPNEDIRCGLSCVRRNEPSSDSILVNSIRSAEKVPYFKRHLTTLVTSESVSDDDQEKIESEGRSFEIFEMERTPNIEDYFVEEDIGTESDGLCISFLMVDNAF
jgi:hypothetical protein